jgi:hypothetical protein
MVYPSFEVSLICWKCRRESQRKAERKGVLEQDEEGI